ncbi:MAG: glycosyltransferase family 1 protein [Microgenomates group bacterium]|nr:glycosyltransferase family 1 protein [Microgenomates group bacterium]
MKKIGIDARLYFQTGVGVYLRNFLYWLEKEPSEDKFIIYVLEKDQKKIKLNQKKFILKPVPFYWHTIKEQIGFYQELIKDKLDLMHFTYFSYPIFYRKKFIATIHDLTPLFFKTGRASTKNRIYYEMKFFFFKKVIATQIKNAKAIITPSFTVKKQIISLFGKKLTDKIFPIYEGINFELEKTNINKDLSTKFKNPFFIYIGNFYPHKNLERLIKAYVRIKTNNFLLLIGPEDFFCQKIIQLINQLDFRKKVFVFKNPKIEDLLFFYKNAKALIHPSLAEGFGLPLIEAAHFNLPIIASDIEIFHEILGDQFLALDPLDEKDIQKKIEQFLVKPLSFDYQKILPRYSFKKMTQEIIKLYKII